MSSAAASPPKYASMVPADTGVAEGVAAGAAAMAGVDAAGWGLTGSAGATATVAVAVVEDVAVGVGAETVAGLTALKGAGLGSDTGLGTLTGLARKSASLPSKYPNASDATVAAGNVEALGTAAAVGALLTTTGPDGLTTLGTEGLGGSGGGTAPKVPKSSVPPWSPPK